MKVKLIFGTIIMMFVLVQAANAGTKENIQKYFNDTATKVKATNNAAEKRDILNKSLKTMSVALERVEKSGLVSQDDRVAVNRFKSTLQEMQDELNGADGYEYVSDAKLNAYSDYMVQTMEQADKTITIGVVTALLIVVILLLL
jgi:septation ring formation regulator EzrA